MHDKLDDATKTWKFKKNACFGRIIFRHTKTRLVQPVQAMHLGMWYQRILKLTVIY